MPDALPRLLPHPCAVMFHVLRQPFGIAVMVALLDAGMDRLPVPEFRRELDHRLADRHRHRVQVGAMGGQAQTLRLQRDRSAARKRVTDRRQRFAAAFADFRPGAFQHLRVGRVLPFHRPR